MTSSLQSLLLVAATTATLTGTLPSQMAVPRGCDPSGSVLTRLGEVCYYVRRQSKTWRDSSAVMVTSPAAWARLWPAVRVESEPVCVLCNPAAGLEGTRFSQVLPPAELVDGPTFWHVVAVSDSASGLKRSCWSNTVAVP